MINAVLLLVAFVSDVFISSFFSLGFIQTSTTLTPNIFLITLILMTYKMPKFRAYSVAIISGIVLDTFNRDIIFQYSIIYPIIVFIVRAWSKRINNSMIEVFLLVLASIFVKDVMLYFYYNYFMNLNMSFNYFVINHLGFSLLLNVPFIIIGVLISLNLMDREKRDQIINKQRASIRNQF